MLVHLRESSRPLFCIYVSRIHWCKVPSSLWRWYMVTSLYSHVTNALGSGTHDCLPPTTWMKNKRGKKNKTKTNGIIWGVQPLLTFSNYLLHSDLMPSNCEGSSNEISACMTGSRATTSSRTRPRADQLPTRIKELPHVVDVIVGVFVALDTRQTDGWAACFAKHWIFFTL